MYLSGYRLTGLTVIAVTAPTSKTAISLTAEGTNE